MLSIFTDHARARMQQRGDNPDAAREAERLCRTYAVLGRDGAVVTACHRGCWRVVGHRYRRVPRG